jgi:hypothetical protein
MDPVRNMGRIACIRIWPGTAPFQEIYPKPNLRSKIGYKAEEIKEPQRADITKAVAEGIQKFLAATDVHLEFLAKKDAREIIARLTDPASGKVIREYSVISMCSTLLGLNEKT